VEKIKIVFDESEVAVTPPCEDILKPKLSYWHKSLEWDDKKHCRVSSGSMRKLYQVSDGQLRTLPGFVSRVVTALSNYEVELKDERRVNIKPDLAEAVKGLRGYQVEPTYDAIVSKGGIVNCPTGYGKGHMISAVCKAYPKERLASVGAPMTYFVVPSVDLCEKNWREMQEILPGRNIGIKTGTKKVMSDDIIVTTPESLKSIDISDAGLVIYDEVHTLSDTRMYNIMRAHRAMKFGFSATPSGRFDNADLMVEGTFGPVVCLRTYQDGVNVGALVPIKIIWLPLPKPDRYSPTGYKQKDAEYRNGLWLNYNFHNCIAELDKLIPADMQTLYMADTIKHMDCCLNALKIPYVHAETSAKKCEGNRNVKRIAKKERGEIYKKVESGEYKRVISTGIYRTGVNFTGLELVVNLAGRGSSIIASQLPGRSSRKIDGKECAYLIDFWPGWDTLQDQKDPAKRIPGGIQRDAKARHKTYKELGFEQINSTLDELKWK